MRFSLHSDLRSVLALLVLLVGACSAASVQTMPDTVSGEPVQSVVSKLENRLALELMEQGYARLEFTRWSSAVATDILSNLERTVNVELLSRDSLTELTQFRILSHRNAELQQFTTASHEAFSERLRLYTGLSVPGALFQAESRLKQLKTALAATVQEEAESFLAQVRNDPASYLADSDIGRQQYLDLAYSTISSANQSTAINELTLMGEQIWHGADSRLFDYHDDVLVINLSSMGRLPLYELTSQVMLHSIPGLHLANSYRSTGTDETDRLIWARYLSCLYCRTDSVETGELLFLISQVALSMTDIRLVTGQWDAKTAQQFLLANTPLSTSRTSYQVARMAQHPGELALSVIGAIQLESHFEAAKLQPQQALALLIRFGPRPLALYEQILTETE